MPAWPSLAGIFIGAFGVGPRRTWTAILGDATRRHPMTTEATLGSPFHCLRDGLLLQCSELFAAIETMARSRWRHPMANIDASTSGNCIKNTVAVGASLQKYPGAALTLAGAREQTLAK